MEIESAKPKAVLNTNVQIAAELSKNPNSPTVELLRRWRTGQFVRLYSVTLALELREKLEKGLSAARVEAALSELQDLGEFVEVSGTDVVAVITADPDDDHVLACVVVGKATHIVTYDPHFDPLGGEYQGIKIVKPLEFLEILRAREVS